MSIVPEYPRSSDVWGLSARQGEEFGERRREDGPGDVAERSNASGSQDGPSGQTRPAFGGSGQCSPHSVFDVPDQRPARACSPGAMRRVQGAHPIEANPSNSSGFTRMPLSAM